jgi:hypothetical protein
MKNESNSFHKGSETFQTHCTYSKQDIYLKGSTVVLDNMTDIKVCSVKQGALILFGGNIHFFG